MIFLLLFQSVLNEFYELMDDILSLLAIQLSPNLKKPEKKIKGLGL